MHTTSIHPMRSDRNPKADGHPGNEPHLKVDLDQVTKYLENQNFWSKRESGSKVAQTIRDKISANSNKKHESESAANEYGPTTMNLTKHYSTDCLKVYQNPSNGIGESNDNHQFLMGQKIISRCSLSDRRLNAYAMGKSILDTKRETGDLNDKLISDRSPRKKPKNYSSDKNGSFLLHEKIVVNNLQSSRDSKQQLRNQGLNFYDFAADSVKLPKFQETKSIQKDDTMKNLQSDYEKLKLNYHKLVQQNSELVRAHKNSLSAVQTKDTQSDYLNVITNLKSNQKYLLQFNSELKKKAEFYKSQFEGMFELLKFAQDSNLNVFNCNGTLIDGVWGFLREHQHKKKADKNTETFKDKFYDIFMQKQSDEDNILGAQKLVTQKTPGLGSPSYRQEQLGTMVFSDILEDDEDLLIPHNTELSSDKDKFTKDMLENLQCEQSFDDDETARSLPLSRG
jgi:hypothetical protein